MATSQQDIDNSEQLLNLSNKILDSLSERRKLLKTISTEEALYSSSVRKQQQFSQEISANAEKYLNYQVKSKDLAKQIKNYQESSNKSNSSFSKIENKLIDQRTDAVKKSLYLFKDLKNQKENLSKIDSRIGDLEAKRQVAINKNDTGLAKRLKEKIKDEKTSFDVVLKSYDNSKKEFEKQKDIAKTTAEILKNEQNSKNLKSEEIKTLEESLTVRKRIESSTGALGALAKAASKIPGVGQYLKADEAIEEMEKLAIEIEKADGKSTSFANRSRIAWKGLTTLAKGYWENLKSPEFLLMETLKANTQIVALGKALGSSSEAYRENLVDISRTTNNLNVNTASLAEAFNEIVKATGFAYNFSADQLVTQIKLTKQVGLTANEAAQVQRYGALNNKTSEETYRSFLKGIVATRNQLRVGIDFKATLAEAANVSGQLAANLGFNPELIAKAVVTAKALGLTFEQLKSATSSLLSFASSLESELDAELLIGKQLNLERARAAALAGDQVTLAEELAKNVGTAADFTRLNVLQQDALSKAVGMTSDQLAETLRKREEAVKSGKSLAQVTEEEVAKALERQSIQDKFQAAMLKLQDLIGNILAGPLSGFLDVLSGALNIVNLIGNAFSFLATPLKIIAGIFGTLWTINKGILLTEKYLTAEKGAQLAFAAKYYAWEFKNFLMTKGTAIWENIKSSAMVAQIARIPTLLGLKSAEAAIATETAAATVVTAEAATFGAATLWIVGGLAAVLGALAGYSMKDGIIDPNKGPILSGNFGSVKLDPNDKAMYGADGKIKVGTNLMGSEGNNQSMTPSIDFTPMIAAINEVRSAVNNLVNRPIYLSIDGKNIGTALVQGSHKVA
jgi:hypothetical protein